MSLKGAYHILHGTIPLNYAVAMRESMQEAIVNMCCLVLLIYPMGTQFGNPNVEKVMTLCLDRKKDKTKVIEDIIRH